MSEEKLESPPDLSSADSRLMIDFPQEISDYARSLQAHNPDKPCYYHYHFQYRSDHALSNHSSTLWNTLIKLRILTSLCNRSPSVERGGDPEGRTPKGLQDSYSSVERPVERGVI